MSRCGSSSIVLLRDVTRRGDARLIDRLAFEALARAYPRVCSASGDAQVAEVGLSTRADPQSHLTAGNTSFQVVHDQRRLWRAVDEQPGPHAVDVDAQVRPDSRFEVDVRFVDARVLSSKFLPGELRW